LSDNLPEKVIPISTLRINRDKNKKCTCYNRKFEIDTQNREISCQECGAVIDPYDALFDIASHYEQLNEEVTYILEQRKILAKWKPHLVAMRKLEGIYRGSDMLPCCPHCNGGIYANELLVSYVSKKHEEQRRIFTEKAKKEEIDV